jgi:hypothetical protein
LGKIVEAELPQDSEIHVYHIAGDWHSFNLHIPTYNILIQHALLLPPNQRRLIINGDFIDAWYGMKGHELFKTWKGRATGADEFFLPHWEEEAEWANDTLDALQSVFTEIILIGGNHDQPRLDAIKKVVPTGYHYHFDFESKLRLKERGIKYIDCNDWLRIGKLMITHGQAHGTTACKKHYEKSGAHNVIFSHVHQYEVKSFHCVEKSIQVMSLPAMCDLNPEYMAKFGENNWTNGFGVFSMKSNGHFNSICYQIWDDELVLPTGKVIKGDI